MPPAVGSRFHIDWEETYERHGEVLARLERFLESYEREHGLALTPGAIGILFTPLVEMLEDGLELDEAEVASTFRLLVSTMDQNPTQHDEEENYRRSSLSVLRAIWLKWCDIPPFCRATEEEERQGEE